MAIPKSVQDNKKIIRSLQSAASRLAQEVHEAVVKDKEFVQWDILDSGNGNIPTINGTHKLWRVKRHGETLNFGWVPVDSQNPNDDVVWKYWTMLTPTIQQDVAMFLCDLSSKK